MTTIIFNNVPKTYKPHGYTCYHKGTIKVNQCSLCHSHDLTEPSIYMGTFLNNIGQYIEKWMSLSEYEDFGDIQYMSSVGN